MRISRILAFLFWNFLTQFSIITIRFIGLALFLSLLAFFLLFLLSFFLLHLCHRLTLIGFLAGINLFKLESAKLRETGDEILKNVKELSFFKSILFRLFPRLNFILILLVEEGEDNFFVFFNEFFVENDDFEVLEKGKIGRSG